MEVGGVLDVHGTGVLTMFFKKDAATWFFTFQINDEEKTWKSSKDGFVKHFEDFYATSLYNSFDRKKPEETMETYVKNRVGNWSKLFPSLSKPELNMIVIAGISQDAIKKLKLHKYSDQDTLIALCEAVAPTKPPSSSTTP